MEIDTINNISNIVCVNEETIDMLYGQAPVTCTREQIMDALHSTNNNVMEALDLLWDIPQPPPKPFKFLDDVREIADACDKQMEERDMKNRYFTTIK